MITSPVTRRRFMIGGGLTAGAFILAACTKGAPKPDLTVSASPETIGGYPLKTLEGAELVTDPSLLPATFHEAPELADLVAAGKLPPIQERLGQDPLVVKPVHEPGQYVRDATMRRGTISSDKWSMYTLGSGPGGLLTFDLITNELRPNLASAYEKNADATEFVVHLRRGMRWSDGAPFTAGDLMFWYEDMYLYEEMGIYDDQFVFNGEPVKMEKVDDFTVRYTSPGSWGLFDRLFLTEDQTWLEWGQGGYAPKHYLQQFHPKYVGRATADRLAKEAGASDWIANFLTMKSTWVTNADLPVIMPWKVVKGREFGTGHFAFERNPYSIWVDTDGNQLPYIGTITLLDAGSEEGLQLSVMAGEYDFQDSYLDAEKLPLFAENEAQGSYNLHIALSQSVDLGVAVNLSYEEDPEIGELLRTPEFRQALSMGIDRDQLNAVFLLGLGRPSSYVPGAETPYYPGDEYAAKWASLDVDQANALLDGLGLTKGSDGLRQRRDGGGTLRIEYAAQTEREIDFVGAGEMIRQQWKDIGIDLQVSGLSNNLMTTRGAANQLQLTGTVVGSPDLFLDQSAVFPSDPSGSWGTPLGVSYAKWFQSNGKEGKEPFPELKAIMELWREGYHAVDDETRLAIGKSLWQQAADLCLQIGCVSNTILNGSIYCAKTNLGNVPGRVPGGGDLHSQGFYFSA